MVNEPHLADDQLTLERHLSLQALQRQQEDPFQLAFDGWRQLAYGDGGYGHDSLGLAEELAGLGPSALRPLHQALTSSRGVLAVAGQWPSTQESQLRDLMASEQALDPTEIRTTLRTDTTACRHRAPRCNRHGTGRDHAW